MPKLDLTPWRPGAVFRPFALLFQQSNDAERITNKTVPGFNAIYARSPGEIPTAWKHAAAEADVTIARISMASRGRPPE